jgi:putative serine protease PepD
MSDTPGERPAEPADGKDVPQTPPAPAAPWTPAAQPQPPAGAVPPQPPAGWQAPSQARPAGAYPGSPQQPYGAPQRAGQPASPYASQHVYGQNPGQPGYGQNPAQPGYGQNPGQPGYGQHPGQPYASSLGPAAGQTQPTLPLSGGQPPSGSVPTGGPASAAAPKNKSGAGKVVGLIVAAAIVGGAAGLGGAVAGIDLFGDARDSPAAGPETVVVNDTEAVSQTNAIAAKVVPAVVTISASGGSGGGTGSGAILTEDGYVVTNTHVVTLDGSTSEPTLRVTTADGRVFDAEIVGLDPMYDLAVIKLEGASDLPTIDFASSSELNVGDAAMAVGAPLGLSNTVTTGIVSALNRSIQIASSAAPDSGDTEGDAPPEDNGQEGPFYFDFGQGENMPQASETISIAVVQTDAAINPGNSGGALVDGEGNLIGINVAIATAGSAGQSGSIGVGFSIPSDIVKRITDDLIANGVATHGLLGANVLPAASIEGSTTTGAHIEEAVAGGAAEAAGLQEGDVVVEFNGVPITDATDLTAQVRALAGGTETTLVYIRGDVENTVDVTLGTLGE